MPKRLNDSPVANGSAGTPKCSRLCLRMIWLGVAVVLTLLVPAIAFAADQPQSPRTVEELWADFDPRQDALDAEVVREWEKDGIVYRSVTFHIGTFHNTPARMAAFFGFPKGATHLPGLLHLHGGGQRAFLHQIEFYAKQGYACLTINWGGREMENAMAGDPNTDWGAVDPTQTNVPGYFNLKPGPNSLDPFESPRNNNWYLLTVAARRGLTFLEQQPEVDAGRLGVYGDSMGGCLTTYVAGTDRRTKAAAPSVGGSGFRTKQWPLLPQQAAIETPNGAVDLFDATIGFESYAPRIEVPLLWLGATNDFHGIIDDTYRTGALIPHQNVRYAFTPHMNHRFTPEFAVTRPLWFDQHLKAAFTFPTTPATSLLLATEDQVPRLQVVPDASQPVADVRIYYSIDPDPRARFWRSATSERVGDSWTASLPLLTVEQPLFAFANIVYPTNRRESEPYAHPTNHFSISSLLHAVSPAELQRAGVKAADTPSALIDDFAHGYRDWYQLSTDNPHHWEYSTRKLTDPKRQGEASQRLTLELRAEQPNALIVILTENLFRPYRGQTREFVAVAQLHGGGQWQSVALAPEAFQTLDGQRLSSWKNIDLLTLRAYYESGGTLLGTKSWAGTQPEFRRLWWQESAR